MKETESHEATPEQLLQILDAQLAAKRSQRANAGRNRATILAVGILFILFLACGSLLVLNQMLQEMRPAAQPSASDVSPNSGK
jgi:hypothetical protein